MSRPNKPWYWKEKKAWYANIGGKRTRLAKNKEDALRKFHSLKAQQTVFEEDALQVVMDEMLTWTENNRSNGTLQFYKGHAQQFIDFLKENKKTNITCDQLTVDLFESFLKSISKGRRNGAVQMIKRVYNWGIKRGRIKVNPIMALEKPAPGRRKNIVADSVYKQMISQSDQNLKDLMIFCWETGARPQEAWKLVSGHIQQEYQRCVIPNEDTKRKKGDRHIYCNELAWEIVQRLGKNPEFLFTTTTGTQWNKDNVGKRMDTLGKKIGKRYALYDLRHTRITKMVKAGMDTHLIAKLVGTSVLMIEKYYDHSDEDAQFMLNAAQSVA